MYPVLLAVSVTVTPNINILAVVGNPVKLGTKNDEVLSIVFIRYHEADVHQLT